VNARLHRLPLAACLALAGTLAAPARAETPNAPFDSIEISGSAVVRYTQGPDDQAQVEGDEEMRRSVRLQVHNGQLQVQPTGSWKFWKSQRVQVNVSSRELRRVAVSGAADFLALQPVQAENLAISISGAGLARFEQLRADELRFSVSGAGNGQFSGAVDRLKVQISGRSDFRGEGLAAQSAQVGVSGIGHVRVWVQQELSVSVSGIGTVDYWGNPPSVKRQSSGLSTLNDRGAKPAGP
jgi:hypothetical protein